MANLTISDTTPRTQVAADGTTGPYAFSFPFFALTEIKVIVTDTATGVSTAQIYSTDYSVSGTTADDYGFSGGTITFTTAQSNATITIYADYSVERDSKFPSAGPFDIAALNKQIDKFLALLTELTDEQNRALLAPAQDSTSLNLNLPQASERASKFLSFDGNGEPVMAAGTSADLTPVSTFINTLLDDADAAAARATLDALQDNISATQRLLGRNTAGSGDVEEVTLTQLLDWVGSAANGDILIRSSGSWTRLAKGTDGQVLRLASGLPSWSGTGLVTAGAPLVQNPFAVNTTTTQAHGLSATPSFMVQEFECLTAEHGYSIGDIVELNVVGPGEGTYSGHGAVEKNSTNLVLRTTNATYGIPHKTTRAINGVTPANWKLTITPYLVG